jgi:hypothetical protein
VTGPDAPADGRSSIWPETATCPRDWVSNGTAPGTGGGCPAATEIVASAATGDQSAIEEAAALRAASLQAMAPRIPVPRPDVVPVRKPVRVARASSGWPSAPPPNCAAGQHAKWRFVDRKSGSKEWYCR